jgi:hypothetical protein
LSSLLRLFIAWSLPTAIRQRAVKTLDQGRTGDSAKLNTFTQRAYSGVISTGDLPPNKINFSVDTRQERIIININVDKNNAVPNRGTQI